jgi:anti-sigma regulatory factor (Ser/Thr protein kinase)
VRAPRSLKLDLPAVPQSASRARHAVAQMLDGLDVDLWPVGVVVSEAVTNVVVHAYRDGEPGRVELEASLERQSLTLVVVDHGVGMSPDPERHGLGLGLGLIRRLAEHVELASEGGTRLLVRLRLIPRT